MKNVYLSFFNLTLKTLIPFLQAIQFYTFAFNFSHSTRNCPYANMEYSTGDILSASFCSLQI